MSYPLLSMAIVLLPFTSEKFNHNENSCDNYRESNFDKL